MSIPHNHRAEHNKAYDKCAIWAFGQQKVSLFFRKQQKEKCTEIKEGHGIFREQAEADG
jgi:hypothetical protein